MYWSEEHTTHRLIYSLAWTPINRKRVLSGPLADRLSELFHECAFVHDWHIAELHIQPDQVQMIVQLPPSISVHQAVQFLKKGSSRIIRQEYPAFEEFSWGNTFWANGYGAQTVD